MRTLIYLALFCTSFSIPAASRADQVLYTIDFTGVGGGGGFGVYSFLEPAILTTLTSIPPDQLLTSSGATLANLELSPTGTPQCPRGFLLTAPCLQAVSVDGYGLVVPYVGDNLQTFGAFGTLSGGLLTISPYPEPTPTVPEPSSGSLLVLAALAAIAIPRGRRSPYPTHHPSPEPLPPPSNPLT